MLFKHIKSFLKGTDLITVILTFALSVFGTVAVSSATYDAEKGFLSRDAGVMVLALCLGMAAAFIISVIDYDIILKLWPIIGFVSIGLMLSLFAIGVSPDARSDAISWIKLPGSLYFQPSEIVKIGFIITFAFHLSKVKNDLSSLKTVFFLCVHAMIPIVLVVATGDMGSALIFALMFVGMMLVSGVHWLYFPAGALIIAAASPVIWLKVFDDIQRNRILALFDPDSYPTEIYQQSQALKAIQNGGFTGMGLYQGELTQSTLLPEKQNDMIFSVICEETGFIGALILLLLFLFLAVRIIAIGKRSENFAAEMICYGVAFMIIAQAVINIGMCTSLLPVIGITLPFISAGGSSTVCLYLAIGLVMSVYRSSKGINYDNDYRFSRIAREY